MGQAAVPDPLAEFLNLSVGTLTVGRLLLAVGALLICVLLTKFVVKYADRALTRTHIERSLHTFLKSALNTLLYIVTALIVADSLGIPITSLVALLSVVGLAVSLSVQNTLLNLLSGLLVLATRPFIVGDYIAASDAEGTVLDVGLIYTQLASPDDKIIFLPNGLLSSGRITNYTRSRKRRLELVFYTFPDVDPDAARPLLLKALEDPRVLREPEPPSVRISGVGESGVQYATRAWVATGDYWDVLCDVNERVVRLFQASGIRVPGRQTEVRLHQDKG